MDDDIFAVTAAEERRFLRRGAIFAAAIPVLWLVVMALRWRY